MAKGVVRCNAWRRYAPTERIAALASIVKQLQIHQQPGQIRIQVPMDLKTTVLRSLGRSLGQPRIAGRSWSARGVKIRIA